MKKPATRKMTRTNIKTIRQNKHKTIKNRVEKKEKKKKFTYQSKYPQKKMKYGFIFLRA